jgi:peptide deformylase
VLRWRGTGNKEIEALHMAKRRNDRQGRKSSGSQALEQMRVFGDPVLRQETHTVTTFDESLSRLADRMFEIMEREDGVGLAAPQIGLVSRIMVWKDPDRDDERHVYVNPRIVRRSETTTLDTEGCLSVPAGVMEVPRADEVVVEAQDLDGRVFQVELSGFQARVVQHEIDHLDGHTILDRTSPEERKRALKTLREQALGGS